MAKIVAAVLLLGSLGLAVGGRDAAAAGRSVVELACQPTGNPGAFTVTACSESAGLNTACPTTSVNCAQTLANFLSADSLKISSTTVIVSGDIVLYTLIK
jgi:hypothetical protein